MRKLVWISGALALALATVPAGCGGDETSTSSGPSGPGSGGSGGAGGAGSGGAGGSGGSVMPCTPGDLSSCGAGEYCNANTMACVSCADMARFEFTAPESLTVPLPEQGTATFPRIDPQGSMYFAFRSAGMEEDIAKADLSGPGTWQMGAVVGQPVSVPVFKEGAPLALPNGTGLENLVDPSVDLVKPVLLFESDRLGGRKVFAINPGEMAASPVALKGTGNAFFQIAVAQQATAPRLWYMSNSGGSLSLHTALPNDNPVPVPVVLNDAGGCHAQGDLAPWVTPDGKYLLFHARALDNVCNVPPTSTYSLYYTALKDDGTQMDMEKAKPLFAGDPNDYQTPSLAADMCTLYFTHVDAMGTTFKRAVRK